MRCLLALAVLAGLCACTAAPPPAEISSVRFGAITLPRGVARSNADLAQDFVDLTFGLESGEDVDHLLRYEAPVRVYLRSTPVTGPFFDSKWNAPLEKFVEEAHRHPVFRLVTPARRD